MMYDDDGSCKEKVARQSHPLDVQAELALVVVGKILHLVIAHCMLLLNENKCWWMGSNVPPHGARRARAGDGELRRAGGPQRGWPELTCAARLFSCVASVLHEWA